MTEPLILRPEWPAPAAVHAAVSTRVGGVSVGGYAGLNLASHVGDDPPAVVVNRQRLVHALELPSAPVWLDQVHGTACAELERGAPEGLCADAAFTRQTGVVCAVLTADCLPVLLCNAAGTIVAAVHAGWRGLLAGVVAECVRRIRQAAVGEEAWMAWLGPCIGPAHFEVGPEVRAAFIAKDAADARAFRVSVGDRYFADLPELARRELQRCGIGEVHGGQLCTYSDPERFYSYRRDPQTGRMATLIWR